MFSSHLCRALSSPLDYSSQLPLIGHNNSVDEANSRWFAVSTRSRQEKVVATALSQLEVRHYLPMKWELRQWSDRKQMVEIPLFVGYLFVKINLMTNSRLQVLKVPGVAALLGNQIGPLPIPDRQIEDIRRLLSAGAECSVQPILKEGDRVRVIQGALSGIEGILVRDSSPSRLLISIELIRQSISVNIARNDVMLIDGSPGPQNSRRPPPPFIARL